MPRNSGKNKQKVTLSIDSEVYKQFQDFCQEYAFMLSKKVENFMKKELAEYEKPKKK